MREIVTVSFGKFASQKSDQFFNNLRSQNETPTTFFHEYSKNVSSEPKYVNRCISIG